mmetsp:Transcript_5866/g.24657  ORF Transcript_5866/g.24657 Transcript_5866/m.24657 type:complete len:219 (+) Transcript_5866:513-1169(+)
MNDLNQAERVLELALERGVPTKSAGLQSLMKMYLRRKYVGAFKELISDVGEKAFSLQKSEVYEAGIRCLTSFGKRAPTPFTKSPCRGQWCLRIALLAAGCFEQARDLYRNLHTSVPRCTDHLVLCKRQFQSSYSNLRWQSQNLWRGNGTELTGCVDIRTHTAQRQGRTRCGLNSLRPVRLYQLINHADGSSKEIRPLRIPLLDFAGGPGLVVRRGQMR